MALPRGRRIRQDKYIACCPAHDDRDPSLSISQNQNTVLVHCWSGCSQSEVIDALRAMGLWPRNRSRRHGFSQDQREYMAIWVATYQDNIGKGYTPSLAEQIKYSRYRRVMLGVANG